MSHANVHVATALSMPDSPEFRPPAIRAVRSQVRGLFICPSIPIFVPLIKSLPYQMWKLYQQETTAPGKLKMTEHGTLGLTSLIDVQLYNNHSKKERKVFSTPS